MRRVTFVLLVTALVAGLSAGSVVPADGAVKKCPKGKVTRVVNGKRTCASPARFRQRATPPPSAAAAQVRQVLAGGATELRLRNGRLAKPPLPASVVNAVSRQYLEAEAQLVAALQNALARKTAARPHELGVTGGTVTTAPDGLSATATVGFGGDAGGHAVSGKLEFTGKASGRLDVGFDLTVADPSGATKTTGLTARDIMSRSQACPDATGKLPITRNGDATARTGETFGSKRVHLGTVREATTSTAKSRAQVTFGPDGKAKPFTFTTTVSYDSARTAQVLAFFSRRTRVVGTGTMTGTLDPATGKVTGATVTTTARATGFDTAQAAANADARALMERLLNEEVGRLLDDVRTAEKDCTGPFQVTLAAKTDAQFATHSASGSLNATLLATKNAAGQFTGSVPIAYEGVTFASTIGCAYHTILSPAATFDATITIGTDGFLTVKWNVGDGSAGSMATSATVQCPPVFPDPPPPPVPGQPGPQMILPAPIEFGLVGSGGERAIGGGFQDGGSGWTHTGTITVKRVTT